MRIGISGKGGVGKTTICALVIKYLIDNNKTPILAIDADPNCNLAESLGLKVNKTVGALLEEFQDEKINIPVGFSKESYLQYKLNEVIVEGEKVDLLTMGRGEGKKCYCFPNLILREFGESLSKNYPFTIIDNEAGMEHLSRQTDGKLDLLFIICNNTIKGIRTAAKIEELATELKLDIKRIEFIMNIMNEVQKNEYIEEELNKLNINILSIIPYDELLLKYDNELIPLVNLPNNSKAVSAVNEIMKKIV